MVATWPDQGLGIEVPEIDVALPKPPKAGSKQTALP